ncbi:WYL domain-containing protein, partial [Streptomyces sp. NRRL F-4489]|uniref:WYL domain-containing protein n=1 Tax=Streptomyces sp. NRRL F-4489 TaxID=1609095 RepID=UPI000B04C006
GGASRPGEASGQVSRPGGASAAEGAAVRPGFRVYRVDRFTAAAPVGPEGADGPGAPAGGARGGAGGRDAAAAGRFVRDPEFDLPSFWAERAEQFRRSLLREEITVRLSPRGVRQLRHVTEPAAAREAVERAEAAGGPDARGRLTVTLAVESEEVAYAQLLGLGPEAEVLAPAGLRERFAAAARRAAALYGPADEEGAAAPD